MPARKEPRPSEPSSSARPSSSPTPAPKRPWSPRCSAAWKATWATRSSASPSTSAWRAASQGASSATPASCASTRSAPAVTTVREGDTAIVFCNGQPDKFGYPERICGYDAPGTIGVLAKTDAHAPEAADPDAEEHGVPARAVGRVLAALRDRVVQLGARLRDAAPAAQREGAAASARCGAGAAASPSASSRSPSTTAARSRRSRPPTSA